LPRKWEVNFLVIHQLPNSLKSSKWLLIISMTFCFEYQDFGRIMAANQLKVKFQNRNFRTTNFSHAKTFGMSSLKINFDGRKKNYVYSEKLILFWSWSTPNFLEKFSQICVGQNSNFPKHCRFLKVLPMIFLRKISKYLKTS
jgi:hypothetical protein